MRKKMFTLIEVMVALVIISVLVVITAKGSGYVMFQINASKTKSQIKKLEAALLQFKNEYKFNYIPAEIESRKVNYITKPVEFNPNNTLSFGDINFDHSDLLLKKDAGQIKFCSRVENKKHYDDDEYVPRTFLGDDYEFYDETKDDEEGNHYTGFRDGWGNLLMYRCPGEHNKGSVDIWSRGPDGEGLDFGDQGQDDEDDFTNWKQD